MTVMCRQWKASTAKNFNKEIIVFYKETSTKVKKYFNICFGSTCAVVLILYLGLQPRRLMQRD